MVAPRSLIERLKGDRAGVAAVEFALVCPVLIFLMIGMVVWGGWFWLAHSVQAMAAEGARAAVAGLSPAERDLLARQAVTAHLAATGAEASLTTVSVNSDEQIIRVSVAYDASAHPVLILADLVPAPPRVIERTASVRTGGY